MPIGIFCRWWFGFKYKTLGAGQRPYQPRLFGEEKMDLKERYKVIATNLDWPKDVVVKWYDARGEYSENQIKELKIGFSMERMPSSYFKANAVFLG